MVNHQTSHPANAAPAGVVLRGGGAAVPAFCRRTALHLGRDTSLVRCSMRRPGFNARFATGGRGAVGRALCFRNRALRPSVAPGLLRGVTLASLAAGTDVNRGLAGSEIALMVGAGASAVEVLIRSKRAHFRASPTQRGLPPPAPCDCELPSHAPNSIDCLFPCDRLYACAASRGDEKLRH
jgi:hypothetical protein